MPPLDLQLYYNVTSTGPFELRAPLPLLGSCSPEGLVGIGEVTGGSAEMAPEPPEAVRLRGNGDLTFGVRFHGAAPSGCAPGPDNQAWPTNRTGFDNGVNLPFWLDVGNVTLTIDLHYNNGSFCWRNAYLEGAASTPGQAWLAGGDATYCV